MIVYCISPFGFSGCESPIFPISTFKKMLQANNANNAQLKLSLPKVTVRHGPPAPSESQSGVHDVWMFC